MQLFPTSHMHPMTSPVQAKACIAVVSADCASVSNILRGGLAG